MRVTLTMVGLLVGVAGCTAKPDAATDVGSDGTETGLPLDATGADTSDTGAPTSDSGGTDTGVDAVTTDTAATLHGAFVPAGVGVSSDGKLRGGFVTSPLGVATAGTVTLTGSFR